MLAILSRLNRAFFLGLNSICRRFRFIVQFSFLKTSKSQHFFQQGPISRRQFEMPEKCAKSALQILYVFRQQDQMRSVPRNIIGSAIRVYAQKLKYIVCGHE